MKFYDEPHKIKLLPFNRQKQQHLYYLSIFVEKFFGLFIQKILTQYKCSTNICSRHAKFEHKFDKSLSKIDKPLKSI